MSTVLQTGIEVKFAFGQFYIILTRKQNLRRKRKKRRKRKFFKF